MKENSRSDDKIKHLPITENEKILLQKKIFKTIHRNRSTRKRTRFLIGIAATLGLLVAGSYYYNSQLQPPSLTEYISNTEGLHREMVEEMTLILGEDSKHKISEETDEIQYSSSGKKIAIGASKVLNQDVVENEKAVFNTLMVPYGRRMKTELSDGSLVWLNSGSKLIYPAVFAGDKREVYIEGEAIFEVAHNEKKPFYVISDNQVVKVLGTVFSVTNYTDENTMTTILKSGSVQISYSDKASDLSGVSNIKLSPGTKASFSKVDQNVVSEKVNVDTYFSWREGFIVFKKNDFKYIMRRLSRYYNLEININNEAVIGETFSGYLNLNEDIEIVLQSIQASTDFEYQLEKNVIIIN